MSLLKVVVDYVDITGDSWTASSQHFLSIVVVYGISSDFKNHLVLPLQLEKLDLLGNGSDVVERVFEGVSAVVLPGKRIAVTTTDNRTNNMIKRNVRWRNRKMVLCCCSHVKQGDKNTMKRWTTTATVFTTYKSLEDYVKLNPALQKEIGRKIGN